MADFDGIPLSGVERGRGGAVLFLQAPAAAPALIPLADRVEVELKEGSRGAVVRGIQGRSATSVMSVAPECAHRALDIVAMRGGPAARLENPSREHIVWWSDGVLRVVRAWSTATMTFRVGAVALTVRDSSGNLVPQPTATVPTWHPSMRYFRMSQTTDDLYDAFRNIYLALESVLSHIEPVQVDTKGRPEKEGAWTLRALARAATLVDLKNYLPPNVAGAPVEDVFGELYKVVRTSIFHAKSGRPVLLPQDQAHRAVVADAKARYTRLFIDLANHALSARFLSGGLTNAAFDSMFEAVTNDIYIEVTADPTPAASSDTVTSPQEHPTAALASVRARHLEQPGNAVLIGSGSVRELRAGGIRKLGRFASLNKDGVMMQVESLDGVLGLDGFDRLECVVAAKANNGSMPRTEYAT